MATKRIYDLTNATTLNANDKLPVDRSGGTARSILATDFATAVRPYASTLEAQTGTATDRSMTPANVTSHFENRTTAFTRTLLDDADAATARTTLGALASADYTAADVLSKLVTVDGSGSGLDADLVRGTTPTAFGLSLLDDANAAAGRTTLGLATIASSGSGADLSSGTVANAALANMAEATIKGRASGAGTGAPQDLTAAQVKAILGGTGVEAVATRTALKALSTASFTLAQLTEAGREGLFRFLSGNYSALVTADAAEGIYIKADDTATTAGAWVRVYTGKADARWFGISTGNSAATNTTAANNAVATLIAMGGGTLMFPRGTFQFNAWSGITNVNDLIIEGHRGDGSSFAGGTIFAWQNATGDCIGFANCQHSGVRGIYHRHDVRRTDGFTVRLADSCFHPIFEGRIDYAWNGVNIYGCSEAKVDLVARYTYGTHNIMIEGTASLPLYGATIKLASDNPYPITGDGPRKTWSNGLAVSVNDIVFSPVSGFIYQVTGAGNLGTTEPNTIGGTTGPDGFTATITNGTATLKFVSRSLNHIEVANYAYSIRLLAGTHVLNGYRGLITSDAASSAASRPKWIYLEQFEADHCYWNCVELFRGESVYLIGAWLGSSLTARGLSIDAGFAGDISIDAACRISGNWLDGIYCGSGFKNLRLSGCQILDNSQAAAGTYHGILVDASTRVTIAGITATGSRQGYGIFLNTSSDYYAVVGNNCNGNATGGINNVPGVSAGRREVANNITI